MARLPASNTPSSGPRRRVAPAGSDVLAESPDRDLLPDENKNLEADVLGLFGETFGKEWLSQKNSLLGLRTPGELLGTSDEYRIRDILRSFRSGGLS